MKLHIPKILSDKRGIATLELALLLPFLMLMLLGIFDYSRAIHAKNIITNMSREGANLAARSGIDLRTTAQEYMDAIAYTAQPLNMQANGKIYISVVQGVGSPGSVISTVKTKYTWTGGGISPVSKIGAENSPATGLGPLSQTNGLASGETVYVVEVFYHYHSRLFHVSRIRQNNVFHDSILTRRLSWLRRIRGHEKNIRNNPFKR